MTTRTNAWVQSCRTVGFGGDLWVTSRGFANFVGVGEKLDEVLGFLRIAAVLVVCHLTFWNDVAAYVGAEGDHFTCILLSLDSL